MDKKTGEILGLIVGILGLLVALVALAIAIPRHGGAAATAVLGGTIGIAIGLWLFRRARSVPPFSIHSLKSTFQITQPDGAECVTSKEVRFRCNYSGQTHFQHRNIYADGDVLDFRWVGDGFLDGAPKKMASEYSVMIAYEPSWPVNKEFRGTLSYRVKNTFLGNPEWVAYVCDRSGTDSAAMEVRLPHQRACTKAWACEKTLAGEVRHLASPKVSDQGTGIAFEVRNPQVGSEYYVYWEW